MAAEKCFRGHFFAAGSEEFVDDEVVTIGELLVEGGVWFCSNVGGGDDELEAVKG